MPYIQLNHIECCRMYKNDESFVLDSEIDSASPPQPHAHPQPLYMYTVTCTFCTCSTCTVHGIRLNQRGPCNARARPPLATVLCLEPTRANARAPLATVLCRASSQHSNAAHRPQTGGDEGREPWGLMDESGLRGACAPRRWFEEKPHLVSSSGAGKAYALLPVVV